ncbi:MAG: ATP-binding protein [Micrococcales bacterium]|nr:ATP-binding protein [Micrococcales bacterium]
MPHALIGRDAVLLDFEASLENGPGAPGLLRLYSGARGTGKTVMLAATRKAAEQHGWASISDTAIPGLASRLCVQANEKASELKGHRLPRIESISLPQVLGGGGVTFAPRPETMLDLRLSVGALLDLLEKKSAGLLITVDEVHRKAREDLVALATAFQHLVTEGRSVGLALAGLPSAVSDLLNDDVLTFLRRAQPCTLASVSVSAVRDSFARAFAAGRIEADPAALDEGSVATNGYPFMVQLVGYHLWQNSERGRLERSAAGPAIRAAREQFESSVLEAALVNLSEGDRAYLAVMAQDDGPSLTNELASRLNKRPDTAAQTRLRLLAAEVITPARRGQVDFAIPYLREYIRAQAADLDT